MQNEKDFPYLYNFYKNSTGQLFNLLFLAYPSEHYWQNSPSI